jgi:hypothetical protein
MVGLVTMINCLHKSENTYLDTVNLRELVNQCFDSGRGDPQLSTRRTHDLYSWLPKAMFELIDRRFPCVEHTVIGYAPLLGFA